MTQLNITFPFVLLLVHLGELVLITLSEDLIKAFESCDSYCRLPLVLW